MSPIVTVQSIGGQFAGLTKHYGTLMGHYLAQAVETPSAFLGGIVGMIWAALIPSQQSGAAMLSVIVLCALDQVAGTIRAIKKRQLSPTRMADGFFKVFAYVMVFIAVRFMLLTTPAMAPFWNLTVWILTGMFSAREFLSLAKHFAALSGQKLPRKLLEVLNGVVDAADEGKVKSSDGPAS